MRSEWMGFVCMARVLRVYDSFIDGFREGRRESQQANGSSHGAQVHVTSRPVSCDNGVEGWEG